ncbi:drug/metabolite transporter (DMT)-like permease [Cohnella thailandensis]|nr:drug/metabolite transporter (DMT)-like permease [Cohnella thailandensis]
MKLKWVLRIFSLIAFILALLFILNDNQTAGVVFLVVGLVLEACDILANRKAP